MMFCIMLNLFNRTILKRTADETRMTLSIIKFGSIKL